MTRVYASAPEELYEPLLRRLPFVSRPPSQQLAWSMASKPWDGDYNVC
jgi:hypothetical protein